MRKRAIGIRLEDADNKLRSLCENRAKEIYGQTLPIVVSDRLRTELDSITDNQSSSDYLLATAIADYSKNQRYPVSTRGLIASTFVAFLCGFTSVNPLPAHRWCEKCHRFELADVNYRTMGYDLDDKECPKCGSLMRADGANILPEIALGLNLDKEPDLSLNLAEEMRPSIIECIKNTFTNSNIYRAGTKSFDNSGKIREGVHPGGIFIVPGEIDISKYTYLRETWFDDFDVPVTEKDYHELWEDFKKYDLFTHRYLDLLHKLEISTEIGSQEIRMNDKNVLGVFLQDGFSFLPDDSVDENAKSIYESAINAVQPSCFSELAGISAVMHGVETWKGNGEELIEEGKSINEIITCRDDIMQYLIECGVDKEYAYLIMNRVRLGKGLNKNMEDELFFSYVPDWYIESCNKIKYVFPKSHAVEYMLMYWKLAYYYHYFPEEFQSAVSEVCDEKWC